MKLNYSFNINNTMDKVFSYLENPEKQKLWIANVIEIKPLPDEKDEKGEPFFMVIKENGKIKEYKGYTLHNEKPKYLHILVEDTKFSMEAHYFLSSNDENENITKLDYKCIITTKGIIFGILVLLSYPFTRSLMKLQFYRLKRLVEKD